MAQRPVPVGLTLGTATAIAVTGVTLLTLLAVAIRGVDDMHLSRADWAAVRFTVIQAVLSAGISVGLAIPVARALARRRFAGRSVLIALLGAPFLLPVVIAVMGILAVFGRAGVMNDLLGWAGLPPVSIYGLQGVVLAHVFFNLPLATRLILQGWMAIPAERFRLAASLGAGPREIRRWLEWPMLRDTVPGALFVVFSLCLTSFAVALILGGGPRATTVELAIYQAFRFDFALGRAAVLSLVQVALAGSVALLALRVMQGHGFGAGLDRVVERWDADGMAARGMDAVAVGLTAAFLVAPMAMIAQRGVVGLPDLPGTVWAAAGRSLLVAGAATALTVGLSLTLAVGAAAARRRGAMRYARALELAGYLGLAASPLVLGTGLFLILSPWSDPVALALPVTAAVNALAALPFATRVLVPAVRDIEARHGRLADSLNITGLARLRWLLLPRLRGPLAFAAGLTAALSIGDLGVIALFADPRAATLPLEIFRLMSAYRMDAAAGASLILLLLTLGVFWGIDRGGRGDA